LFQVSFREQPVVLLVFRIRAFEDTRVGMPDFLAGNKQALGALAFRFEAEHIPPGVGSIINSVTKKDLYFHFGIVPGMKTTEFLNSTPILHGLLKSPTSRFAHVAE
jgi:hypothetical protein